MSAATATRKTAVAAFYRPLQHVNAPTASAARTPRPPPPKQNRPTDFLFYIYEPNPRPINCTTYTATRLIVTDWSHPLHIKTKRRLDAFDPSILHWNVKVPLAISKKAVVRNWAKRRIGAAFTQVLKERGWDKEGKALDAARDSLRGALCLRVRDTSVLEASAEQVKQSCGSLLGKILRQMGVTAPQRWERWSNVRAATRRREADDEDIFTKREEV